MLDNGESMINCTPTCLKEHMRTGSIHTTTHVVVHRELWKTSDLKNELDINMDQRRREKRTDH